MSFRLIANKKKFTFVQDKSTTNVTILFTDIAMIQQIKEINVQ